MNDDILAAMRERYGDQDTESYVRMMKALDSLVFLFMEYQNADDGSALEAAARMQLDLAMAATKGRPDHAVGLIEGLIAIVVSMRFGGSYEQWFHEIGIEPRS